MFGAVPAYVGVGVLRTTLRYGVRWDLAAFDNGYGLPRCLPQFGPKYVDSFAVEVRVGRRIVIDRGVS